MWELISIMTLVVFAVFGAYCLIRLIWENHFVPEGMQIAVTLSTRDDVRALPDRIHEIFERLSIPNSAILVLVPETLYEDPECREDLYAVLLGYEADLLIFKSEKLSDYEI